MSTNRPQDWQTADLNIKLPVEVDYHIDMGEIQVKAVRVVHGPLSLDVTALLTEDDFFEVFQQLHDWYVPAGMSDSFEGVDDEL